LNSFEIASNYFAIKLGGLKYFFAVKGPTFQILIINAKKEETICIKTKASLSTKVYCEISQDPELVKI